MNNDRKIPLLIATTYAVIGACWIYYSEIGVSLIATDPAALTRLGTIKGWIYVAVTSLLLYWLIVKNLRKLLTTRDELESQKRDLETLLLAFPDHIFKASADGRIMGFKEGVAPELLTHGESLAGKPLEGALSAHIATFFTEATLRVSNENAPASVEFSLYDPQNQQKFHYEARIVPFATKQFVIVVRNTTKLKQAEKEQRNAVARIAEEKAKSEAIIAAIRDGITIQDTDYRIMYQNQVHKDLIGDHTGEYCYQAYEKHDAVCTGCPMKMMFEDGKVHKAEWAIPTTDSLRHLENTASPIRDAEGIIIAGLQLVRDITEQKLSEEKLRTTQEFLSNLTDLAPMPIYVTDSSGCFQMVNRAWEKFTGVTRDIAIGTPVNRLYPQEAAQKFMNTNRQVIEVAYPLVSEDTTDSSDGRHYFHTVKFPLHDAAGEIEAVGGISVDITERKRFEEQLVHQATHDFLTGLPNRNLLHERLVQSIVYGYHHKGTLALLLLDLDNFKIINDTFGHPSGDLLLKDVTANLKKHLRQYDTIARLGGDEFVILISDPDRNLDLGRIAERILTLFETPLEIKGQEVFVTASIGISIFPDDGDNADVLLKNADAAMFHAKKRGKNTYQFFTEAINSQVHERLAMETKLRRALEREEFFLHYQPRVEMSSGRIVGMEALLRWQPEGGKVIPPAEFIPLLEDTGLIVPVEEWVLRTACLQTKVWQDVGLHPLRLSVNISARHFSQENLSDRFEQILYETGLQPHNLEIELTESIIMKDVAEAIRKLDRLKELGITLAIDDFGTGYSSLNYLKRFPIDVLKIDRSFVGGIPEDSSDATIATTVIVMAHNLKMRVVAEGVENEDQLSFLTENRCDEFQGYYFSKPLPAEGFIELARESCHQAAICKEVEIDSPRETPVRFRARTKKVREY